MAARKWRNSSRSRSTTERLPRSRQRVEQGPGGAATACQCAGDRADLLLVRGFAGEEKRSLDGSAQRAGRATAADPDVAVGAARERIGAPVVTRPRIELLLELASRDGEDLGQRHETPLQPRRWLLREQLLGGDSAHVPGEYRRAHRERSPPRRHFGAVRVQEVQPAPVRTGLRPPLLQELRFVPEFPPESQHDLEHLPRLDARQRALFAGERRIEPHRAGLEDGKRQSNNGSTASERWQRRAVAAAARDADSMSLPLHRLRDRAETQLGTVAEAAQSSQEHTAD